MAKLRAKKTGSVSVTLPPRLAAALRVTDGGYLDVEEVRGGVLLKPLSAEQRRNAALEGIRSAQARVRPSAKMRRLSPEAQERTIAAMLDTDDDE